MTYQEIKKSKKTYNQLFTDCKVHFWAFSNKQFDENKDTIKKRTKNTSRSNCRWIYPRTTLTPCFFRNGKD